MSYPCRLTSLHSFVPIPCTYRTTTADNEREKQIIYWAMHVSQESTARRLSFIRLSLIKAGQHVYFCSQVHNNVSRITDTLAIKADLMTRGGVKRMIVVDTRQNRNGRWTDGGNQTYLIVMKMKPGERAMPSGSGVHIYEMWLIERKTRNSAWSDSGTPGYSIHAINFSSDPSESFRHTLWQHGWITSLRCQ